MANEGKKLVTKVRKIAQGLDDMAFETRGNALSPADQLALAEGLQGVIAGGLTLAWKHEFSEVSGLGLYPSVVRGEKLTAVEIIRQMLNASSGKEAFADALRRLADEICKSPSDDGAEALR